jgi:2'-5' RNA ligase
MGEKVYAAMKNIKFSPFTIPTKRLGVFPTLNYPEWSWQGGIKDGAEQPEASLSNATPNSRFRIPPDPNG